MTPKNGEKPKWCYFETNRFIVYLKTRDISLGIEKNVEISFDKRPLPREKYLKFFWLMKDRMSRKRNKKFVSLIPTTCEL